MYLDQIVICLTRPIQPPQKTARLISNVGRQQVNSLSRQIMQNNINSQELRSLFLPLPPIGIQRKIMRHVEEKRQVITSKQYEADFIKQETLKKIEKLILGTLSVEEI